VQAGQEAADPLQHVGVVQLGPAATAAGADAEPEVAVPVQAAALDEQRRHHRHLGGGQLGGKGVFFQDLVLAPAGRAGRT
jgi:hypothetical protein